MTMTLRYQLSCVATLLPYGIRHTAYGIGPMAVARIRPFRPPAEVPGTMSIRTLRSTTSATERQIWNTSRSAPDMASSRISLDARHKRSSSWVTPPGFVHENRLWSTSCGLDLLDMTLHDAGVPGQCEARGDGVEVAFEVLGEAPKAEQFGGGGSGWVRSQRVTASQVGRAVKPASVMMASLFR
ncbi:hypothetical protein ACWC2K_32020 [Streptomyces chattanoogensis]